MDRVFAGLLLVVLVLLNGCGVGGSSPAPTPTVTLTANPTSIIAGGTSVLTWSSTNATSCTASGGWNSAKPMSGSQATVTLAASASYTLTCLGTGGSTARTATVTVLTPTIAASPTPLAVTASVTGTAPNATVTVTFANAPNTVYFSASDYTTNGIASISTPTFTATGGSFVVTFRAPNVLKPATYTDTATLLLCGDPQCKVVLASSPLKVNYSVTAATGASAPRVTLDSTTLTYRALYVEQFPITATPDPSALTFTNFTGTPYVQLGAPTSGGISAATYAMSDAMHCGITFTFAAPNTLAQNTYKTTVTITVCLDPNCVNPVAGGSFALTVNYVVTNSFTVAGTNGYTIGAFPLITNIIAANSQQNRIYAIVPPGAALNSTSIQELDLTTGVSASPPLVLSTAAGALALSDDGKYLYTNGFLSVEQIQTSTLTTSQTIAVPMGANSVAVEPGQSQTIAVGGGQLQIFDGAVARPNALPFGTGVNQVTWTSNPALISAVPGTTLNDCSFSVNANGVSGLGSCLEVADISRSAFIFANGLGYGGYGFILDEATWTIVATLTVPNASIVSVVPDVTLGKAFALVIDTGIPGGCHLESFALNANAPIASVRLPTINAHGAADACDYTGNRIVRWGTNGLAVSTGTEIIAVSGTFVGP